jgi:membrane protein implicated in regulation of membrane protease activity
MKEIAKRVWNEPAVAIGLLVSIALLVGALLTDSDFDWEAIVAIVAPLLSSLGIRPLVKPTAKIEEENKQQAVANLQVAPVTDTERHQGF